MAVAYRASAQVFGTTASTSITIPASVQAGDIIVLQAVGGWAPTAPAGWTVDYSDVSSSNVRCFVAYKIAGAGDGGTNVTVTWQSSYNNVLNLIAVSGATAIRSTAHNRSSSGNSALTGPLSVANGDMVAYLGGTRQAASIITLDRGVTDISARDGSNNFSGIVGHEAVAANGFVGANFTATGGAGYLYSEIVFDGGNAAPTYGLISTNYLEVASAGMGGVQVGANYLEVATTGIGGLQVSANYVEVAASAAAAQIEVIYAEALSAGNPMAQYEAMYAEVLSTGSPMTQLQATYLEVLTFSNIAHRKGWGIIK